MQIEVTRLSVGLRRRTFQCLPPFGRNPEPTLLQRTEPLICGRQAEHRDKDHRCQHADIEHERVEGDGPGVRPYKGCHGKRPAQLDDGRFDPQMPGSAHGLVRDGFTPSAACWIMARGRTSHLIRKNRITVQCRRRPSLSAAKTSASVASKARPVVMPIAGRTSPRASTTSFSPLGALR